MDSEHRLCRARSMTMLQASSADLRQRFLVPRSHSASDLRGNRMPWSYRPKSSHCDSWYGNYQSTTFSRSYTPRPYLYSNFSSAYSWSPYFYSYPMYRYRSLSHSPIYYSYYYRPYSYYTSSDTDFLLDRIYGWNRDRYYRPTFYYQRPRTYYSKWLY